LKIHLQGPTQQLLHGHHAIERSGLASFSSGHRLLNQTSEAFQQAIRWVELVAKTPFTHMSNCKGPSIQRARMGRDQSADTFFDHPNFIVLCHLF